MSMEQNKRYILLNSMNNQRREFNLKEKILAVQLFESYYNEDLGLFTSAKNTNDIDRDTTIDTIYSRALDKAYANLKVIDIYKGVSKRQYRRWCLNNGMRKSSSRINFEFEQRVWGELLILNTSSQVVANIAFHYDVIRDAANKVVLEKEKFRDGPLKVTCKFSDYWIQRKEATLEVDPINGGSLLR